jgi:peptide deformylase
MSVKAKGWLARIFQHEIDHLNGVLFTDRADKIWKPTEPIEDRV